jgi:hypothetical protein
MLRRASPGIWVIYLLIAYAGICANCCWSSEQSSSKTPTLAVGQTQNWFVREDGGDRNQCTGKSDSPYRGKGGGQPCAFRHPYYLFTSDRYNDKSWLVRGGDTVIIRGGPYRMGYKGPNAKDYWGNCPGDPYNCSMPPVPSGTSEHPTRLLGERYQKCDKKTQLYGGYALGGILSVRGSKNVDIECLELTDHSQCTRFGTGFSAADRCRTDYPLSDFAGAGIVTNAETASITLKNLDIHGLTSRGIIGAIGGEITADHVRIAFNGGAGWDFDDGKGTKSTPEAMVRASYLTVEWNGCNEEYPIVHPLPAYSCFDQDHAGYGDGVGTPNTPLGFTCDHCVLRYNTQDGLDLLHANGGVVVIRNSSAYGNMGQQWKIGAMKNVVFQNNVTIHNCRRLSADFPGAPNGYNKYLSLFCRAGGDGIAVALNDMGTYVFLNNSFAGYGATSYDFSCSGTCTKSVITFQNNLHVGYRDPNGGQRPGVFYVSGLPQSPFTHRDHNIYYNMRTCPSGETERCVDPKIVNLPEWNGEASLDNIDFHLKVGSPAEGTGIATPTLLDDYDEATRSSKSKIDVGAFQRSSLNR